MAEEETTMETMIQETKAQEVHTTKRTTRHIPKRQSLRMDQKRHTENGVRKIGDGIGKSPAKEARDIHLMRALW